MNILLHIPSRVPVTAYGGTERVMWGLGRELAARGHNVTLLAPEGSGPCPFGRLLFIDPSRPLEQQVPEDTDLVHFNNYSPRQELLPAGTAHVATFHGNRLPAGEAVTRNAIFVSANHALRHGAEAYVHNGLDWEAWPPVRLDLPRRGAAFLGKAAWRVKNVRGAIKAARSAGVTLDVLGGSRLNFKMGLRFTPWPSIRFHGMVDDLRKAAVLSRSKALLFPVGWDEPFGLAVIEAMFCGAPVLASPYGSLPELVTPETGRICRSLGEMQQVLAELPAFDPRACHDYARQRFSSQAMTDAYLALYNKALAGTPLNAAAPHAAPMLKYKF